MNYRDISLSLADALVRSQAGPRPATNAAQHDQARPPYTITISREAGALGSSVAAEVGRRLDWPVYDRNILDKIAEELRLPPSYLEDVDERPATWLGECLSCLFEKYHVGSDVYLKHLFAAVRGLGAAGQCVIVGRGANFILPAETTLRVRLVARPEDRVEVVARRLGFSARQADLWVKTTELERFAFVKRAFQLDPTDPHHYDLVLNLSRLSVPEAADVIIETLRRLERRSPAAGRAGAEMEQVASPAVT
jgi:cytidylate kinase